MQGIVLYVDTFYLGPEGCQWVVEVSDLWLTVMLRDLLLTSSLGCEGNRVGWDSLCSSELYRCHVQIYNRPCLGEENVYTVGSFLK